MRGIQNKNEKHGRWRGDEVGYQGLHKWVRRHFDDSKGCENCSKPGRLEWAIREKNKFTRNRCDWLRLCYSCHRKYDLANGMIPRSKRGAESPLSKATLAEREKIIAFYEQSGSPTLTAKKFGVTAWRVWNYKRQASLRK